jgi:hypothetical protein
VEEAKRPLLGAYIVNPVLLSPDKNLLPDNDGRDKITH